MLAGAEPSHVCYLRLPSHNVTSDVFAVCTPCRGAWRAGARGWCGPAGPAGGRRSTAAAPPPVSQPATPCASASPCARPAWPTTPAMSAAAPGPSSSWRTGTPTAPAASPARVTPPLSRPSRTERCAAPAPAADTAFRPVRTQQSHLTHWCSESESFHGCY